jgi:hypothetical protein
MGLRDLSIDLMRLRCKTLRYLLARLGGVIHARI